MQTNREHNALCGPMLMMAGQLVPRPEVDAVESELEANGYAAVPSWRNDGRWELWTREVVAVACDAGVHFTSGPSETFASRDEALAAGLAWRDAQQQP
ncbi:hypothetical protein ABXT21_03320 [Ralstonia sp. SM1864_UCD524_TZ4]|uniref:Uncharacterized protein n=1 Tax=Ralstonia solanacearum TaxID=305 RepID=A0A0S4X792_RALSL|nr:hypothetical protein [Ralstonia pseudosolanacearum]CUV25236.1 conserved protein of unknown function [Ralstonia solanacearum]CUV34182.1 conserved protein of unknown function [Ralstonia solanacearum]CUV42705.1 conserved protein of unknown function [Ralstonia solanacearum]CUV59891.1 conserved protein of unknown function [Ralstonia solanacearum]